MAATLAREFVSWRRAELERLPLARLLELYAELPGRSSRMAERTRLTPAVLVDLIVWTEARGR